LSKCSAAFSRFPNPEPRTPFNGGRHKHQPTSGRHKLHENRDHPKQLTLHLLEPMPAVPDALADWKLALNGHGTELEYVFDAAEESVGIPALLRRLGELGIGFKDLNTRQSTLEEIFVGLVRERGRAAR
jgi:hypothetical protein